PALNRYRREEREKTRAPIFSHLLAHCSFFPRPRPSCSHGLPSDLSPPRSREAPRPSGPSLQSAEPAQRHRGRILFHLCHTKVFAQRLGGRKRHFIRGGHELALFRRREGGRGQRFKKSRKIGAGWLANICRTAPGRQQKVIGKLLHR